MVYAGRAMAGRCEGTRDRSTAEFWGSALQRDRRSLASGRQRMNGFGTENDRGRVSCSLRLLTHSPPPLLSRRLSPMSRSHSISLRIAPSCSVLAKQNISLKFERAATYAAYLMRGDAWLRPAPGFAPLPLTLSSPTHILARSLNAV